MMEINGDSSISPDTKGKFFSKIDFEKVVKMMMQDEMAKLSQEYYQNDLANRLKIKSRSTEVMKTEVENINNDISQNQFYNQYTQRIVLGGMSLDEELSLAPGDKGDLTSLNPEKLLKNTQHPKDENVYYLYFKKANDTTNNWLLWQYWGEHNTPNGSLEQLPNINDLQMGKFIVVKNNNPVDKLPSSLEITNDDLTNSAKLFWNYFGEDDTADWSDSGDYYSLDGKSALIMDGKSALQYRFQEYFKAKIINNFYENVLTMTYLESNLFNIGRNIKNTLTSQDSYLNISSDLAKATQTWNQNDGYKSKLKMVWAFNQNDKTEQDFVKAWSKLNETIKFKNSGEFLNSTSTSFQTISKILEDATVLGPNQSELGTDPFLNLAGYNGIVKNDGDSISSADGTLSIAEEAKTKIAKVNSPAIITKDQLGQPFTVDNNKQEIYFVLPIYLIDLLNDTTNGSQNRSASSGAISSYDYGQTTTGFLPKTEDKWFASFGDSLIANGKQITPSKVDVITSHKEEANKSAYYLYVDNVAYTIDDFNGLFNPTTKITPENIWDQNKTIAANGYQGFQFTMLNSFEGIIGNVGIGQEVYLGKLSDTPINKQGITFEKRNDDWYAIVANDKSLVGTVVDCGTVKLSFDDAKKGSTITFDGSIDGKNNSLKNKEGRTIGYQINMGPNAAKPNMYINNGTFHYYEENLASLDIINLASDQKQSLLHQLEYITSKDSDVSNAAASAIYPLFIGSDQVLYKPLYESIRRYIDTDDSGESD